MTTDNLADRPWGKVFEGRELDALIQEALANNSDLRIAADRVELARAQFGFQRSFLYPAVGLSASGTRQRGAGARAAPTTPSASRRRSASRCRPGKSTSGAASARRPRPSRRDLLATEDTRRALHTSIVAQVASGYLELLSLDAQLAASRRTAAARRESLRLIELRYKGGVASRLELNDQISLVAGADRAIASFERSRSLAENALSTLVGRNPGPIARERQLADLALPVELPAGLPSALLTRRYDVLAAEQTLYGADANIDAARKAFFPTITLTGIVGFASPALRDLFDSGRYAWSASPGIGLPIFNAGRLTSNLEAAQAQQRIAVEQYKRTIRVAFREVEDALASYQRLTEERTALTEAVNANRERLRLSELRYRAGVAAYFEVLDSSRQLFDSELSLIQVTAGQYQAVIQLYQALGGGYDASTAAAPSLPATPYSAPSPGTVWWF